MSKRTERPALLVRVLTEIGAGRIYEGWLADKQCFVHGETDGKTIRINPAISVVDTVIHEALHRLEPGWSESYVRRTTTWMLRRMSDEQIQQLYTEYQRIAKKRKIRGRSKRAASGTDSSGVLAGSGREVSSGAGGARREHVGEEGDADSRDTGGD